MFVWQDLLNFDDPLNLAAAEHFQRDKVGKGLSHQVGGLRAETELLSSSRLMFAGVAAAHLCVPHAVHMSQHFL